MMPHRLAGFHADSLFVTQFTRAYAKDHMLAYVNMSVQTAHSTASERSAAHERNSS